GREAHRRGADLRQGGEGPLPRRHRRQPERAGARARQVRRAGARRDARRQAGERDDREGVRRHDPFLSDPRNPGAPAVKTTARILPVLALAATASIAWIATGRPQDASVAPTPEHKLLEKYAGTWDAEISVPSPTGGAPQKSAAKATARVTCGGLWLVTDFEGSMMGGPFTGHEVFGYDPTTKRYVLTWVDSTSASPNTGEFTWDEKARTLEGSMKGKL